MQLLDYRGKVFGPSLTLYNKLHCLKLSMTFKVLVLLSSTARSSKIMRQLLALMGGIGELRCLVYARTYCLKGESGTMGQQEGIPTSPNLPLSRCIGSCKR